MMSSNIGLGSDPSAMMMGNSGDISEDNNSEYYGAAVHNNRPRYPGLYVGNLTWWTTDQDIINAISSFGVKDVQEVKFFENRNNGQSRGFCVVTFSSETSLPVVKEKLPKVELHGQMPIVTPYTRQNLSLFESQNKSTRPQINNSNNSTHAAGIMGISSISGVHAGSQGLPFSGFNQGGMGGGGGGMGSGAMGGGGMGGGGMGGMGGPRGPGGFGMRMRGIRPSIRGQMQNSMSNGPMGMNSAPGPYQMNRMRFLPPPSWDNTQSINRHDEVRSSTMSSSSPTGPSMRHDIDSRNSRNIDDMRSSSRHDDEIIRSSSSRHDDGRTSSSTKLIDDLDSRGDRLRREEIPASSHRDDRSSARGRDETHNSSTTSSSRRLDRDRSPSRRDDRETSSSSSRRDRSDRASSSSRRDERSSSRREEKSSSSSSSSRRHHDRERSHRSRSRSRDRSHERSRDRRDRRDRDKKDRY